MSYLRAKTVEEALQVLARQRPRVVCGGTDCYADPASPARTAHWLDISQIAALRGIEAGRDQLRIGAATAWDDLVHHDGLPGALRQAARAVGTRPIRLQGSLGGNLCHASPVADGMPPLLALQAWVELASLRGRRSLPVGDFMLARRQTALAPDELLLAVTFDAPRRGERSAFIKCGQRDGSALAIVSAAVRLMPEASGAPRAMVSVGGASEVPVRLAALEAALASCMDDSTLAVNRIRAAPLEGLAPVDDCRGSADLRRHLARVAIERAYLRAVTPGADMETDFGMMTETHDEAA